MRFNWPDKSSVSKGAFEIIKKLRAKGFESYIAGGAVRDALLKRPIQEIDITTAATPQQVKKLFPKTIPTGEKHGTITVRQDGISYEVTTFRSEGKYKDNRRPSKVKYIRSAEADANRRDFTINALFYDPVNNEIIDHVSGLADLKKKTIRLVGDAEQRIHEDALRMLRAVRIACQLHFDIDRDTRRAIQKNVGLVKKISAERIKQELDKLMMSVNASIGISVLDVLGLLQYILPELKRCQGVRQPKNQHSEGDVYAHSLLALEQIKDDWDLPPRYAILFHDLGKAETRVVRAGRATFYDHQNVGAEIAVRVCKRLKFSSADTAKIEWLVRSHMVPFDFPGMKLGTRRKWALSPYFRDLLKVYLADIKASIPAIGRRAKPRGLRQAIAILRDLDSKPELSKRLLSGNDVMRILKIKSGPTVGKILKQIEEKKLSGELKNKKEAINYLTKIYPHRRVIV